MTPQQPNQQPAPQQLPTFKFLSYYFDKRSSTAIFCYQGIDNLIFTERVTFASGPKENYIFNPTDNPGLETLLNRALFLAFIAIGTSYYKAHPTQYIQLDFSIDEFQAYFFNKIFQEGLSQFAFENRLTRAHLAHFYATKGFRPKPPISYNGKGILSLQSGGKDSILTATMLNEQGLPFDPWYLTTNPEKTHPLVIDNLNPELEKPRPALITVRKLDLTHLQQTGGLNGHVPITLIVESLALIQAILLNKKTILTSVAQEGTEPSAVIGDLPVNHQWAKTWEAEQLLAEYVKRYLSPSLIIGSPIRHMSELMVAEQFIRKCWRRYGYSFSSCNVANYRQFKDNSELAWCGNCAKCANTYLLFAPFLPPTALESLFADYDLFAREGLFPTFQGLLGINNQPKPFECVGSVDELRAAYHLKQPGYADLPFAVPKSNFDYHATYPVQPAIVSLFQK